MAIASFFSRTKSLVLAGLAGVVVTGVTVWSAGAVSPFMEGPPIVWAGGVPAILEVNVPGGTFFSLYRVPAGVNFMLTDLIITNSSDETAAQAALYSGAGTTDCGAVSAKMRALWVRPKETLVVPLNTGVGFSSGQHVCVSSVTFPLNYNVRGYLFKASQP